MLSSIETLLRITAAHAFGLFLSRLDHFFIGQIDQFIEDTFGWIFRR